MMFIYFIALIVLRSNPAFAGPTGQASSSSNPTGCEQINHTDLFVNDIGHLLLNKKFSDVVLQVGNEELHAHRVVLASRSNYFSSLLYGEYQDAQKSKVPINEGSAASVKVLLQYIYFGRIDLSILESEVISDLLILSNVYRFTNLQLSLCEYLIKKIDVHNVSSLFTMAFYYQIKELEVESFNFIVIHTLDVLQSDDSLSLTPESLLRILNRDTVYANEFDIFRAVCRWIKKKQNVLAPDAKTKILSAVRYELMDDEELFEVRRSELVRSDTIVLDVINDSVTQTLNDRGRLEPNVNFAEYPSKTLSQINGGTMLRLALPSNINYIEMKLRDEQAMHYSYYIEVSTGKKYWLRVVDHSNYHCRSIQRLWINRILVRYIRIVGINNDSINTFDFLKVMYNTEQMHLVKIKNGLVAPTYNVALSSMDATVIEGKWLRTNLLNGDYKNYDENRNYTYHTLKMDCIKVQLAQPYMLSSIKMLLWDCDHRTYGFDVASSVNNIDWEEIPPKYYDTCRSWQLFKFELRPIVYIRITGYFSLMNDRLLKVVHLEAPAQESLEQGRSKSRVYYD